MGDRLPQGQDLGVCNKYLIWQVVGTRSLQRGTVDGMLAAIEESYWINLQFGFSYCLLKITTAPSLVVTTSENYQLTGKKQPRSTPRETTPRHIHLLQELDLYEAQLNCYYNSSAKQIIQVSHSSSLDRGGWMWRKGDNESNSNHHLLLKSVWVFVNGVKQTTNVSKCLKHNIDCHQARGLYSENKLLSPKVFNVVDC